MCIVKFLTFLIYGILLSSVNSFASYSSETSCNDFTMQKYILIHGIGGSSSSFGAMKKLIPKHIECSEAYYFEYDTKNSKLSVPDFSLALSQFINKLPKGFKDLNLVMHSQGGLVGLNWLINSYQSKEGFFQKDAYRVNNFVSFSTPFWGSDFALLGEQTFFNLGVENNPLSPFGKKQLIDMKYGSNQYQWQLDQLISDSKFNLFLKNEVNVLNIVGITSETNDLVRALGFSNTQFFEGDLVVNTPSMKLNFLFGKAPLEYVTKSIDVIDHENLKLGKHVYVYGMHMDLIGGIGADGVVEVPKKCEKLKKCKHDGYMTFLNYINDKKIKDDSSLVRTLHGFEAHIQVSLPPSIKKAEDIEVEIEHFNDREISLSYYRGDYLDYSPVQIKSDSAYFIIKGSLNDDYNESHLIIKINHSKSISRRLMIKVEKDNLTHIKANLLPLY